MKRTEDVKRFVPVAGRGYIAAESRSNSVGLIIFANALTILLCIWTSMLSVNKTFVYRMLFRDI